MSRVQHIIAARKMRADNMRCARESRDRARFAARDGFHSVAEQWRGIYRVDVTLARKAHRRMLALLRRVAS